MILSAYLTDLPKATLKAANIVQKNATEPFQTKAQQSAAIAYVVFLVLMILFFIASAAGAASLSWNYNMFLGTSKGLSVFYMILAFLFSELYYPIYAFFFNPITSAGTLIAPNANISVNALNKAINNASNKRNNKANNMGL